MYKLLHSDINSALINQEIILYREWRE